MCVCILSREDAIPKALFWKDLLHDPILGTIKPLEFRANVHLTLIRLARGRPSVWVPVQVETLS